MTPGQAELAISILLIACIVVLFITGRGAEKTSARIERMVKRYGEGRK